MQLLLEHTQRGKVFRLWAKYELLGEEEKLVGRYDIRKFILVEGNPRQERERALKMAAALAVVVGLIAIPFFGTPLAAISWGIPTFVIAWPVTYMRIKETIRVRDMLDGRHFSCRSITTLLQKEDQIGEMGEIFTRFLERLKNWEGREVIEMAPGRPPVARSVERPRAAE